MSRGSMTMRAQLTRPEQTTNVWNQPGAPAFRDLGSVPCRVYEKTTSLVLDEGKKAVVGDFRAMFPLKLDVQDGDHLTNITDRREKILFSGPFEVVKLINKKRHRETRLISHA